MNRLPSGKGVYIWRPKNIFGGDPEAIADELEKARVDFVAIKLHDGTYQYPGLEQVILAIRARRIVVIGWGYVYLTWDPISEAYAASEACRKHNIDVYLIDAEAHAKYKFTAAKIFAAAINKDYIQVIGMNSYYRPDLHKELPWKELRKVCDFDTPQVYWRGYDPVGKLYRSLEEYAKMDPILPMPIVAGDMYFEHNMKPTPQQVTDFLDACKADMGIQGVLMWSMDQMSVVPELWRAFSDYTWHGDPPPKIDPVEIVINALKGAFEAACDAVDEIQVVYEHILAYGAVPNHNLHPLVFAVLQAVLPDISEDKPLYAAVVDPYRGLRVHNAPGLLTPVTQVLLRGDRVEVWSTEKRDGYEWANIGKNEWVALKYLNKI